MKFDPHNIVGKEVKAADGGDYGHRVLGYNPDANDYIVQAINWSTGKTLDKVNRLDEFKITYRYDLDSARPINIV